MQISIFHIYLTKMYIGKNDFFPHFFSFNELFKLFILATFLIVVTNAWQEANESGFSSHFSHGRESMVTGAGG